MNFIQLTMILEAILVIKSEDISGDCLSCDNLAFILSKITSIEISKSFVENCVHFDNRNQLNHMEQGSFLHFLKICGWLIDMKSKKSDFLLPGRTTGLRLYPPSRTKLSYFQSNIDKNNAMIHVLTHEFNIDEVDINIDQFTSIIDGNNGFDKSSLCITPQYDTHSYTTKRSRRSSSSNGADWVSSISIKCEGRFCTDDMLLNRGLLDIAINAVPIGGTLILKFEANNNSVKHESEVGDELDARDLIATRIDSNSNPFKYQWTLRCATGCDDSDERHKPRSGSNRYGVCCNSCFKAHSEVWRAKRRQKTDAQSAIDKQLFIYKDNITLHMLENLPSHTLSSLCFNMITMFEYQIFTSGLRVGGQSEDVISLVDQAVLMDICDESVSSDHRNNHNSSDTSATTAAAVLGDHPHTAHTNTQSDTNDSNSPTVVTPSQVPRVIHNVVRSYVPVRPIKPPPVLKINKPTPESSARLIATMFTPSAMNEVREAFLLKQDELFGFKKTVTEQHKETDPHHRELSGFMDNRDTTHEVNSSVVCDSQNNESDDVHEVVEEKESDNNDHDEAESGVDDTANAKQSDSTAVTQRLIEMFTLRSQEYVDELKYIVDAARVNNVPHQLLCRFCVVKDTIARIQQDIRQVLPNCPLEKETVRECVRLFNHFGQSAYEKSFRSLFPLASVQMCRKLAAAMHTTDSICCETIAAYADINRTIMHERFLNGDKKYDYEQCRDVCVQFDEVHLYQKVEVDHNSGLVRGFVGDHNLSDTYNLISSATTSLALNSQLAATRNSFIVVPFLMGFIGRFICAAFNCRNLTAAHVIEQINEVLLALTVCGFNVLLFVSDGGSPNMKAQKALCTVDRVNKPADGERCLVAFKHPITQRNVHFGYDPCHAIMKCFRNNLSYSVSDVIKATRQLYLPHPVDKQPVLIKYDVLILIYDEFADSCGNWDPQPGITREMYKAADNNYSKMNTAQAAKMFSNKHQNLLKRWIKWVQGGRNSSHDVITPIDTERIRMIESLLPYFKVINEFFDVCNSRDLVFANKLGGNLSKRRCVTKVNITSDIELTILRSLPTLINDTLNMINTHGMQHHYNTFTHQTLHMAKNIAYGMESLIEEYHILRPNCRFELSIWTTDFVEFLHNTMRQHTAQLTVRNAEYATARATLQKLLVFRKYVASGYHTDWQQRRMSRYRGNAQMVDNNFRQVRDQQWKHKFTRITDSLIAQIRSNIDLTAL